MKRNYVKVIAAVVGMTMVYCPLTLNAKSKKNATAAPSEIAIHGYGETASFTVDSRNLRSDEPILISATNGFEVSPRELSPNSKGTVTVKLISSKQQTTGKVILRSGDTRYYVAVKGVGKALPVKDLSTTPTYQGGEEETFEKAFNPSADGYTIEFKVATPTDGDEFYPFAIDSQGNGFKSYVSSTAFGLFHSTSKADGFTNPSTNVTGGRGKFYNNDGKAHTYRIAVMPDNRAFFYRDGIAVDTVRLHDYGLQPDFATGNGELKENLLKNPGFEGEFEVFGIKNAEAVRIINRYDISGLDGESFEKAKNTILSETNADTVYDEKITIGDEFKVFAMEYLPGQYDQRADSAAQCVQLLTQGERPQVVTAKVIAVSGNISDTDFKKIKDYLINPVESRLASFEKPESLDMKANVPDNVAVIKGFTVWNDEEMEKYYSSMGFAMTLSDLKFCRDYFRDEEHRDPTVTELRVIDTYWSDHCRHTTFLTRLEKIEIEKGALSEAIENALKEYYSARDEIYGKDTKRDVSLMDMAIIGMKLLRKRGLIPDLDVSDEINACSIEVPVTIDGKTEKWLV
mgnify:CR=1 FL=1